MSNLDISSVDKSAIDHTFASQQAYALKLRKSTCAERLKVLARFEKVFKASYDKIYAAAAADFGKPEAEVDMAEIMVVVADLAHIRKKLKKWMKATPVSASMAMLGTSSKIIVEPKGTSLIISPWNYPFNLTFGPMMSAIAAGNTVILKPSEMTPNMSKVIAEIVAEAFSPEEVALFEGTAEVSTYLTSLPFDHIFFTGSPAVGKMVMAAAAKNLTSVTLELGGKSPVIVDKTANIAKAARSIAFGKFSNNGQTCIAPDYLFVDEAVKDLLIAELKVYIARQYGLGEDAQNNGDYCQVVNAAHQARISGLLNDALAEGGQVVTGGQTDEEQRFVAPTLIEGMSIESRIMQEEIFGPLLPIISYSDLDTVIEHINSKPKPLALYFYSTDKLAIDKVLTETSAGGTCINQAVLHYVHPNLPFGGVNNSGIGMSGGEWGFKAFSHERSVLEDKWGSAHMMHPPYTPKVKKLIKMAVSLLGR
jgi:aldehyde dehydrogenase (NAD+)|tara:strand:- start:2667 stop:4100 length:1434 start_codon:yes stop_codon:yes gene_type:complete